MSGKDEGSNAGFNLDDLDWDAALNEWEQKTFVPEVAIDKETKAAGAPITPASTKMQSGTPAPQFEATPAPRAVEPSDAAPTTAMKPPGTSSSASASKPPAGNVSPSMAPSRSVSLSANPPRIVPRASVRPNVPKASAPPRASSPSSSNMPAADAPRAIPPEPPTRVAQLLPNGEPLLPSSSKIEAAALSGGDEPTILHEDEAATAHLPPAAQVPPAAPSSHATVVSPPSTHPVEPEKSATSLKIEELQKLSGNEDDDENTALFGRIFREDSKAAVPPAPAPPPSPPTAPPPAEAVAAAAHDAHDAHDATVNTSDEATISVGHLDRLVAQDDTVDGELEINEPESEPEGSAADRSGSHGSDATELHRTDEHTIQRTSNVDPLEAGDRPSLHSPPQRTHDPDAVTNMVVLEDLLGAKADDAEPTRLRVRTALAAGSASSEANEIRPAPVFEDEKPASAYFDEERRARMLERATRIEAEARTRRDATERARGLLVASELLAMIGETDQASARATEAREIAPAMTLAHVQARTLGWNDHTEAARVTLLDAQARSTTTLAGQLHALLLNADLLRAQGDEEAALDRWEQAMRTLPDDIRAPVARAGRALSRGDLTGAAALEAALPPAASSALATALRLRGHDEDRAGDIPANDSLRRARAAFERMDIEAAAKQIAEMRSVPELASAATWLASMVAATKSGSRADSAQMLKPLAFKNDANARRALAARIVELGDGADAVLRDELMTESEPFAPAEWSVLQFLLGMSGSTTSLLDNVTEASPALGAALAAVSQVGSEETASAVREARKARSQRTAGEPTARKLVTLGRLLADAAPAEEIAEAIAALGEKAPESVRTIGLELALRAGRLDEVADALRTWLAQDETSASARDRELAAGLIAEVSGSATQETAVHAYRAALAADRSDMASIRALLELDEEAGGEASRWMIAAADERGGAFAAAARIEAAARVTDDEVRRAMILGDAHRAAPELSLAAMLAERASRKAKDSASVLMWIGEQRELATDPIEQALLDVRRALASASGNENDRATAGERLAEAHRAFPSDVALRELYERFAVEAPSDRAAWRESRGSAATGPSRVLYFLEAAHEYERAGDREAALRAAKAAHDGGDEGLARLALERAEEAAGEDTGRGRRIDALKASIHPDGDVHDRIETMERLADLEATGRKDVRASIAWHRQILELASEHLPSLRAMEHGLIGLERDDKENEELGSVAAAIARVTAHGAHAEASSHAQLAVRLHLKSGHPWDETRELTELASSLPEPALWALRLADGHARATQNDAWHIATTKLLLERTNQAAESAFLNVRAGEAALRSKNLEDAAPFFERAATEDGGDIVAWGRLAEVRRRKGDLTGAGDALESLARTSLVPLHQRTAWVAAALMWLDEVKDEARGVAALEQAATLSLGADEVFERLVQLYTKRSQRAELAELLERRLSAVTAPAERASLEVQRGRALAEVGDLAAAATALESALELDEDNLGALQSYAEVAMKRSDWGAAETALVRLARLVVDAEEQSVIYGVLGDLYADRLANLSRAETAFSEVLKRTPEDVKTLEKLGQVYRKQKDTARAIEIHTQLVALAKDPIVRRKRMLEMANLHDLVGNDARKAEQVLEAARKESPLDVGVLRALVEFYERHKQAPAVNVLLDRVGGDARRAIAAGRVVPAQLEQLAAVYELRGRQSAAAVVAGSLRALRNEPTEVRGGDGRALSAELDDLLAPELLSPSLRALLARTGDALDVAAPIDLKAFRAAALPTSGASLQQAIMQLASSSGIAQVQVFASPSVGMTIMPCLSTPPTILVGDAVLAQSNQAARLFLAARVLKVAHAHASALLRTPAGELNVLVSAWLNLFNPSWRPEGIPAAALGEAARKIKAGLPRTLPPDLSFAALEVAGALGPQMAQLGPSTMTWANRVALLVVGDLRAAFDAIAWTAGLKNGAPTEPAERANWVANNPEARDLLAFSVGDTYAEARTRLRLT